MRMSGDSVAAVAPVLWLVGAVEYHQVAKRLVSRWQEATERLEHDVAELAGQAVTHPHGWVTAAWKRLRNSTLLAGLALLWAAVSTCLLLTTILALRWLAVGDAGPQPTVAGFCFYAIAVGGIAITLMPIFLATVRTLALARRVWTAGASAKDHRAPAASAPRS